MIESNWVHMGTTLAIPSWEPFPSWDIVICESLGGHSGTCWFYERARTAKPLNMNLINCVVCFSNLNRGHSSWLDEPLQNHSFFRLRPEKVGGTTMMDANHGANVVAKPVLFSSALWTLAGYCI